MRAVPALAGLFLTVAPAADAQQESERGRQLYEQHCMLCHGDSGLGNAPDFPALNANDRLDDLGSVVRSIREGGRRMPPFPALTYDEISSLAGYIRGAWENDYGLPTVDEVAEALEEPADVVSLTSVWDRVFTESQAARGEDVYAGACGFCHGRRLDGAPDDPDMRPAPPLARARFLRVWEGRSLATLLEYTRATMPEDNPGSMTEQEYVDVIAYMLAVGGMPGGDDELQADVQDLARIVIRSEP